MCETQGRFSAKGEVKPRYEMYLRLQKEDRAELRYLLGMLGDRITATQAGNVEYVANFEDGAAYPALGLPPEPEPEVGRGVATDEN